jgi:hypothetical protein
VNGRVSIGDKTGTIDEVSCRNRLRAAAFATHPLASVSLKGEGHEQQPTGTTLILLFFAANRKQANANTRVFEHYDASLIQLFLHGR